ncbi:MAG: methyltransferase domain-containing protein [Methanoregula sp.]|nr:methyltransferase domain-containing protein [Methanoregula sp.]
MYHWNPAEYAANSTYQKSCANDFIQNLTLNKTDKILDIGCGDGKITLDLAGKVPGGYVVGLDLSGDMVRYAHSNFKSVDNISFVNGNAQSLPFYNTFDVIFSNYALHWVPNHYQLLAGIYCALRPKGRVLVQMSARGSSSAVLDASDEVIGKPFWSRYFEGYVHPFQYYSIEEYRSILEGAEFRINRLETIPRQMVHKDRDGLTGMIRAAFLPALERVPFPMREDFLKDVVDVLVSRYPADDNGTLRIPSIGLQYEAFIPG